jgi:Luciferase-like monooxygenase
VAVSVAGRSEHNEREFIACGVPFREKAGRLSESIVLMRRLWSEKSFAFDGKYYQFKEVGVLPKPIQKPGIPIWIAAANNENALRRVAKLGDGWVTIAHNLEDFSSRRRKIEAYAAEFGRQNDVRGSLLFAFSCLGPRKNKVGNSPSRRNMVWIISAYRSFSVTPGRALSFIVRIISSMMSMERCKKAISSTLLSARASCMSRVALTISPCGKACRIASTVEWEIMPSGARTKPASPEIPILPFLNPVSLSFSIAFCAHRLRPSRTSTVRFCACFHQPARLKT